VIFEEKPVAAVHAIECFSLPYTNLTR